MKIEKRIEIIEDKLGHITSDKIPKWAITKVQRFMKALNRVSRSKGEVPKYTEEDINGEIAMQEAKALFRKYRTLEEYHRRSINGLDERLSKAIEKERHKKIRNV